MDTTTTRCSARNGLSLPNILTFARIAAIPVVVGCIYAQSILDGPLWLRWVALAVFIAAAITDFLDGYYARIWDQQSALLRQLRESRKMPKVDPRSPYFAHLRLIEDDKSIDLCLGKATFIKKAVRIVDWRHAPISRIFYRYQQGDEYEEEIER